VAIVVMRTFQDLHCVVHILSWVTCLILGESVVVRRMDARDELRHGFQHASKHELLVANWDHDTDDLSLVNRLLHNDRVMSVW